MRWVVATLLGLGLAFAVQWIVGMPDVVLIPAALSFVYGFENLLASERLRAWLNGQG